MAGITLAVTPSYRSKLFSAESLQRLERSGSVTVLDDPGAQPPDTEVLVTSWGAARLTPEVLDRAPRLRLIAHSGSSVKAFVTGEVFARGIRVTQAGQAMARPVAETALAFTLSLLLRIHRADHLMRGGASWEDAGGGPPRHGIAGTRIGVVGASRTGTEYIDLVVALGADVVVHDPFLTSERAAWLGVSRVDLDELLRTSRVVALHAPTLPETRAMIGRRELALMPDGASLVNTARSWLVDSAALLDELASGRLDAALDVFDVEPLPTEDPLRRLPNVLLTPHRAAATVEGYLALGDIVADEVTRYVAGKPLLHELTAEDLTRMG